MNDAGGRARFAAVTVAAALDVLAHRLRSPAGRSAVRYGSAAALLGMARAAGVSWAGLGLGRRALARGMTVGAAAGACAAGAVFAAAALPATGGFFLDERAEASRPGDLAAGLARITFTAVPPEELTFRSALLGLGLRDGNQASAVAWSSALFGLSHALPTLSTMRQTALKQHLARRRLRQAAYVAGNVVVTSIAGGAFAWLRLRSDSVLAPLLAHAALNDSALVAGRIAHARDRERAGRPGPPPAARPAGSREAARPRRRDA